MVINFKQSSEVGLAEDIAYTFADGIYGFADYKQFVFINQTQDIANPFRLMVALDAPEVSFVVVPPTFVHENYEIKIDDAELLELGIADEQDIMVFSIVSLADNGSELYVNLKSPLVLSMSTRFGRQIILDESSYQIRHVLKTDR